LTQTKEIWGEDAGWKVI